MQKSSYAREELLACARGELFGPGNPQLPLPPMLMVDRIVLISKDGGEFNRGVVEAELDIHPDLWFFQCHFQSDPVMPGCLGLDALWQLLGFFLGWSGGLGRGRALGCGEVKFSGQVLPSARLVSYRLDIKRVVMRGLTLGVANASLAQDGQRIYLGKDLRVGLFTSTDDL